MRIMYFIFEGFDTANGTNHLALTTMQTFLDNGIDVYLVTSHSKGLFPDIPDVLADRKGFTYSVIQREMVEKKNFVQRYMDGMKYAYRASKVWRRQVNMIDLVILQSTPTVFFSAFLLHRYLKKPVIFNSFDVFPDGPYLFGAITNRAVFKVLSYMQKYVYEKSNKIIVISDDMKKVFLKKKIDHKKLVIIPNWYDSSVVREVKEEDNRFKKKFHIDSKKFIVQYAGNFGYTFNYKAVIEVAKILKEDNRIEFHMIGTGGFEEDFKREAADLSNIKFFPWQDSSLINDVYSACDIEFIPLSRGVIWTSFPSKCTLLMACGRTFLCMCEKKSHFYRLVNEKKVGFCIDRSDYEKAAQVIQKLAADRKKMKQYENNAKRCGEKYYSSTVNACKYVDVVRMIAENKEG